MEQRLAVIDPAGGVERYRRRRPFRRLKSPREKVPSSRRLLSHNEADTFDSLYTLDVTTSVATLVGPNGSVVGTGIDGLMYPGDATYVPEPTTFALFSFALAGLGFTRRRRAARLVPLPRPQSRRPQGQKQRVFDGRNSALVGQEFTQNLAESCHRYFP